MSEAATLTTEITAAPTPLATPTADARLAAPISRSTRARSRRRAFLHPTKNLPLPFPMPPASISAIEPASASLAKTVFAGLTAWSRTQSRPSPRARATTISSSTLRDASREIATSIAGPATFCWTPTAPRPRACSPHLDHFIIMDDVELHSLDETTTGIGLTGPRAASILETLGFAATNSSADAAR